MTQVVDDYTALLSGNYWNGIEVAGEPVIVTFSFPTTAPAYDASAPGFTASTAGTFSAFTAAEQAQAIQALSEWAAASGLVFIEVAPGQGDINFQNVDLSTTSYSGAAGVGFYPFGDWNNSSYPYFTSDLTASGDVFMNTLYQNADGTVNYGTLLHEIGHAIGLKHPTEDVVDYAAEPNPVDHDQVLSSDDPSLTIMSTVEDSASGGSDPHLKTLDMEAAAYLYGAAGTGGVYTGTDTVTQWSWNSSSETLSSTQLGATVSGSNSVSDWTWDPATQTLMQTAVADDEAVRGSSVNDYIVGLPGDKLFALDGNDTLQGAGGGDALYGGPGNDTLIGGAGGNTFYINSPTTTVEDSAGSGDTAYATVSFTLPENVDTLYLYGEGLTGQGNDQYDYLYGDGTNGTTLIGGSGGAYMVGGSGNDIIEPGTGVALMFGGGGDDRFVFRSAADAPLGSNLTTIGDFVQGDDKIDLSAITGIGGQPLTFIGSAPFSGQPGQVRAYISGSNTIIEGDLTGTGTASFQIELYNEYTLEADDFILSAMACYRSGTRIRTADGETAVEELAIGDLVVTLSGEPKPIKWIGRRSYGSRFLARNRRVLPIRIAAGAVADGVPARDLWVSPGHALHLDGALVMADLVTNGATIGQARDVEELTYFHIELEAHEVVFAEGLAAETYVDCGNRLMFENAAEFAALFPGDERPRWQFCAPRLEPGAAQLAAIRATLLERAAALGHQTDADADLHLLVDGVALRPEEVVDRRHRFRVPAGSRSVSLASRSVAPADVEAASSDRRRLGVPVERLTLQDEAVSLVIPHGDAGLADGFHEDEPTHRWTDGLARLPERALRPFAGQFALDVHLVPSGLRYWAGEPVPPERDRLAA